MITSPTVLAVYFLGLLGILFASTKLKPMARLYAVVPAVFFVYFIPMLSTAVGITPSASPLYSWTSLYILPFALFLLSATVNVPAILKLGRPAVIMLFTGVAGIALGCILAMLLLKTFLPDNAWQSLATLSATWIGGSANMVSLQLSLQAPPSILGPIIIVDTILGYGWMAVLIAFSTYQARFDKMLRADSSILEQTGRALSAENTTQDPTTVADLAVIVGLGAVVALLCRQLGERLPLIGDPTIISHSTWTMLIVVTSGLLASFTPIRRLVRVGASQVGYLALFFLLTTVGAKASFSAIMEAPLFMVAGIIILVTHVGLLLVVARWQRFPFFFVATGSMANIGGAVSAPIVAGVYAPSLASVGLILGVASYIIGIYVPLAIAEILSWMI